MPYFGVPRIGQEPELHSGNVSLEIRQDPKTALVTLSKKEKNRKPIDPPPIVQMHVHGHNAETSWLVSPYLFLIATLLAGDQGDEILIGDQYVIGQTSSSLNRLKDVDNKDGGFFVFGDISVRKTGWYRLRFSLFNQNKYAQLNDTPPWTCADDYRSTHDVEFLTSTDSRPFIVQSNKDFGGLSESSHLSRTFSDQGVRLRLRKEQRKLAGQKRGYQSVDSSPATSNQRGGTLSSTDYGRTGPGAKRPRADSDYDTKPSTYGDYGRMSNTSYMYPGSNMTPSGYGGYPMYESPGHTFPHSQDYGAAGLSDSYHAAGQVFPDQYQGMVRQTGRGPAPAPLGGPFHTMPVKEAPLEQTSYFNGYPTPTRTGSFGAGLSSQSTSLFAPDAIAQQPHYLPPDSGYGVPPGNPHMVDAVRPPHFGQLHTTNPIRHLPSSASQYAPTRPPADPTQMYGPMGGFNADSLLFPSIDTVNTCAAMPTTPLTSSTLNSAYTAQFGDDGSKYHPSDQPQQPHPSAIHIPQYARPATPR
ncbi:hypothetical protein LTR53_009710 [Teratosphaeriaceae sp. CCFEE 6253]|nr:hypothetical protein LTR53_009710 [Teratosphaeriaceae sp. CCFEE 6253]